MSHNADFHHGASKGHLEARDTDIVLSNEILAASRTDDKGDLRRCFAPRLRGWTPEAEARLASAGPNLVTREGRPSVLRELWGRAKNPLNALLALSRRQSPISSATSARLIVIGDHGRSRHHHGLRPRAPLQ